MSSRGWRGGGTSQQWGNPRRHSSKVGAGCPPPHLPRGERGRRRRAARLCPFRLGFAAGRRSMFRHGAGPGALAPTLAAPGGIALPSAAAAALAAAVAPATSAARQRRCGTAASAAADTVDRQGRGGWHLGAGGRGSRGGRDLGVVREGYKGNSQWGKQGATTPPGAPRIRHKVARDTYTVRYGATLRKRSPSCSAPHAAPQSPVRSLPSSPPSTRCSTRPPLQACVPRLGGNPSSR